MPRCAKQSKRVPLARRYTIAKKSKETERKRRRDAKKNPALRKKLRKDMGIPNLNPFKAQILKRLEDQKKSMQFHELARMRRLQDASNRRRLGGDDAYAGLIADAAHRDAQYEGSARDAIDDGTRELALNSKAGESTRKAFYKHLKSVLEKADVLLEVLDARDPLACRAPAAEALALSMDPPKRIVLVLNKIDLVPPEVVQKWLVYLRKDFPTVAFKASTQQQRSHLAAPGGAAVNSATEHGEVLTGAGAAGADTLLQLLKNYSRSHELKTSVTVGVIGYPNVGKSSIINSMKRSKAVGVSSTPGFTKSLQEVALDGKITLIDCPGIIFDDGAASDSFDDGDDDGGAGLLLRNCVSVDAIEDPEAAVDGILRRCAPEKLMSLYSIPVFTNTREFLGHIAAARGRLAKGGIADRANAARSVLQDWNSGKIPFFVLPPDSHASGSAMVEADAAAHAGAGRVAGGKAVVLARDDEDVGTAAIISGWSKEFNMDEIIRAETEMLRAPAGEEEGPAVDFVSISTAKASSRVGPTSTKAQIAAARLLAEAEDDDEDLVGAEGEDDSGDDDDDDGMDEDDDDDEEESEEEEEAAASKKVRFAGGAAPRVANATAAAAGDKKGAKPGAYNFGKTFPAKKR